MNKYIWLAGIGVIIWLTACSSTQNRAPFSSQEASGIIESSERQKLIEALTDFTIAVDEGDYKRALTYLSDDERFAITGNRKLSEDTKKQLKAIKVHKLIKYRDLRLEKGKITGLKKRLPVLNNNDKHNALTHPEPIEDDQG